ncbi:zinc finger CW-type PWWP domain protein 1-like isoform X2 [Argopecten irradians]|uniref:zinc finger CW-type PWWP domain protein 1-like isoform X2 n=1 Tax=Argopecten irradians TaxID=31199 RepID=UPI003723DCEC
MENHQYNTRNSKKKHHNDQIGEKVTEMEQMSQNLFDDIMTLSQETTPSQKEDREQLEKQINDFTWVQCDDVDCQKWRRLPVSESKDLSQKDWYCHMGTDPKYNSCAAPEEDHRAYDKLARKLGLNYVMSQLAEGTLVWAKMTGYCRWPALVKRDPACGMSCEWDSEGEPQVYHVEFLGTKHSHGWIKADKLTRYGHKEEENLQQRKCRTKQMALNKASIKIQRRKYNRVPVDLAIIEADKLLRISEEQRLTLCTFKFSKKVEDIKQTESQIKITDSRTRNKKDPKQSCCQLCGGGGTQNKKNQGKSFKKQKNHAAILQQAYAVVPSSQNGPTDDTDNEIHSQSDKFQFENLKFKSTLVDKSKEEKFRIDVEMYKRNEKAFDHDLRRFMDRNKVTVRKIPVWQRVPIGLFQLFLSVFERGGFKKVCVSRSWSSVYKELTELPVHAGNASAGSIAKKYYQRNLYPYELYVTGGDYQTALNNIKNTTKDKKPSQASAASIVPESDGHSSDHLSVDDNENGIHLEDDIEEDVDLEAMLTQLEAYSDICQLEDDVDAAQKRLGIDITFHDDSSGSFFSPGIKLADTASEFGLSLLPEEEAQMVPTQPSMDSDNPSHSDQILQELLVLDDEFQQLEQEMADFL